MFETSHDSWLQLSEVTNIKLKHLNLINIFIIINYNQLDA